MNSFGPVITAMVTPFDEYNQLNVGSLRKLIIHLLKHGSTSLVITGTTGEAPTLTAIERLRIWETAVDFAGGSVPIICGVGTNNTKTTIHNVKLAEEIGADGVLVVTPYYNKPNKIGLLTHYKEVANSTDLPIILYNIPSRAGVSLDLETILELAQLKNVVGIKDSSGDLTLLKQLKEVMPSDFALYSGDDSNYLEALKLGGAGVVSVASHVAGLQMNQIYKLFKEGKLEEAEALQNKLMPLYKGLFSTTNPIPIKAILNQMGMDVGSLRLPLVEMDQFEALDLFNEIKDLIDE
ncbi:4-hydroxy-tetrahydrodipicolinate synthase [Turicibacter sanguinis]|uniref:4-hydroxy-tetrahydrodipicolinate synthase n=1 Tax=Turicibacter sanguinis TaxID=154288 RepID=UPI0018A92927|nr:4-hydroxy-tetrahydrodipicolinate synthase [Turicibacter sanguinis]MDB8553475.1 4-hydroxy-tetrahydrodipicolinate synthase [Turicibacter sanguinis]